ncbi:MAG: hypothetical protein HY922_16195 [Elusimicrobia bacterium]|nr:hypothetical protein [Elusimicrobiota bacterium]
MEPLDLPQYAPKPVRVFGACLSAVTATPIVFPGPDALQAILLLGLIFGLPGFFMAFGARGFRLLGPGQPAKRWWGIRLPFLPPLKVYFTQVDLKGFDRVSYREGGSSNSHPVELSGEEGCVEVVDCGSMLEARIHARQAARALSLPLAEQTASGEKRTPPEELGLSLRERLLKSKAAPREPQAPPNSRLRVSVTGAGVQVLLPRPPVEVSAKAYAVIGVLVVGSLAGCVALYPGGARALARAALKETWSLYFAGFAALFGGLMQLPLLIALGREDRVLVSTGELQEAKVMDFGIARQAREAVTRLSKTDTIAGTAQCPRSRSRVWSAARRTSTRSV